MMAVSRTIVMMMVHAHAKLVGVVQSKISVVMSLYFFKIISGAIHAMRVKIINWSTVTII